MASPTLFQGYRLTRRRILAAAALVAGLLLRLWFVRVYPQVLGDTLIYGALAKNLLLHGVYGFHAAGGLRPTLIRLPGYPFFLAACFRLFGMEHYTAVLYAQVWVDLITCLLIASLTANLFGRRAGLVALWIAALCPFTANYVATPLTETLSIFCVALAFHSLMRWRRQMAAGHGLGSPFWLLVFSMSYAILLRPDGGLLPAAVCPAMLFFAWQRAGAKRAISLVLLCSACTLLPLTPWAERNWREFHVFQPLAPISATDPGEFIDNGFNRWYRTWAIDYVSTEEVYWPENSDMIDLADLPSRAFDSPQQRKQTADLLADYNINSTMTPALDARFDALARQRIATHPLRYYIALPLARLADMWLRPRLELLPQEHAHWWRNSPDSSPHQITTALAAAGLNLLYLAAALVGAWRVARFGPSAARAILWPMILFVLLRSALLATIDAAEPRYTLECFPIVLVFAASLAMNNRELAKAPQN